MRPERVVLDASVLISALLQPKGPPRRAVETVRVGGGRLLFSDETYDEVRTRVLRPKFDRYVDRDLREAFVRQLMPVSEWVAITGAAMGCRDSKDDKVLETALIGRADAIVTGDEDLLVMHPFRGIPVLRATTFLGALDA